jgi:hypothetical protein
LNEISRVRQLSWNGGDWCAFYFVTLRGACSSAK